MEGVGEEGQRKWKEAKVLLVGCGGLGSISAQYLCAAGIGYLKIVDFDRVSETNLQRQILYRECDLNQPKAVLAKKSLEKLNSYCTIEAFDCKLSEENALSLAKGCDIIMDGTDSKSTRYLLDSLAVGLAVPYAYASIAGFEGQVAIWNAAPRLQSAAAKCAAAARLGSDPNLGSPKYTPPIYRDLFPSKDYEALEVEPPAVMGPLPGLAASIQSYEVLSYLCGNWDRKSSELLCFNMKTSAFYRIGVGANPKNRLEATKHFESFKC